MGKNRRHQVNAAKNQFAEATSQLNAEEKKMTELVMGEAFKRMAQKYKGKRLSKDEADEILANIIVEVMEEHKAKSLVREQEVMMVAAINTVNAPPMLSVEQIVAHASDYDDESAAPQVSSTHEPIVSMAADENGVYWPTVAYVKGQTGPINDNRLEADVVVHTTDTAATESFAQRVYNTFMGKLRPSHDANTPAPDVHVTFPEPQLQPQAAEQATESTMNTNDTNDTTTPETTTTTLWGKVKAFFAGIVDKLGAWVVQAVNDSTTIDATLRAEGKTGRRVVTTIFSYAMAYVLGYYTLTLIGVGLISTLGLIGLIAFVALAFAWYLFAFIPTALVTYAMINKTIDRISGLFSKSPSDELDGAAAAA